MLRQLPGKTEIPNLLVDISQTGLGAGLPDDLKAAMRAGEKDKLAVLRLMSAAIKQKEVDELSPEARAAGMDDAAVLAVIEKMIKQRKESIAQFEAGNRPDLVAKEQAEIAIALLCSAPSTLSWKKPCLISLALAV